ncbi:MAG: proline dehydrogenase family protein [Candidatus Rhabdochlamydia sp.]
MPPSSSLDFIQTILTRVKTRCLSSEERENLTIQLAEILLHNASSFLTQKEKSKQQQFAQMMQDPQGKVFTTRMIDECFRSDDPVRVASQIVYLLQTMGIPNYVDGGKKLALFLFKKLGNLFPSLAVWGATYVLRQESSSVILPGERKHLLKHMKKRREEGVRLNLNHLGEAILGEEEAARRLNTYLCDLQDPWIEYVSIKISTIFSQINLLAWEETKAVLASRLRLLYRAARDHTFTSSDGSKRCKFVNLDMEEYKDLRLTVDLFQTVLEEEEFHTFSAGIVLQAYLPDSYLIQQQLTQWALKRVAKGGAPIKIRIVKGANLAMEKLEASLKGWPQAPYSHKVEVDGNYRRMVQFGVRKEHATAVELGIASHNLFDLAYALILRAEAGSESFVHFEMLEGMAESVRRAVQQVAHSILLYCPVAKKTDFQSAVAYLIRRLDENTGKDNFLKHSFGLKPGSLEWEVQAQFFLKGCHLQDGVPQHSFRIQNRCRKITPYPQECTFKNEADTDFSLEENRHWATCLLQEWKEKKDLYIPATGLGIQHDNSCYNERGSDPSRPHFLSYKYATATLQQVDILLTQIAKDESQWEQTSLEHRCELLSQVAHQLRMKRGDLIGVMIRDAGKTVTEADSEVSEAIDFAEYYLRSAQELFLHKDVKITAKGIYLIAPPWNFPVSIAVGGILGALIMGNRVIFKPAPETILTGWVVVNILWEAGISKEVLSWVVCEDEPVGTLLFQDPRIAAVVLTGSTDTARFFLTTKPWLDLSAETGGKNGIIVTALCDRDLAIREILHSAFGHAGQKCSAASLLVLEQEVYEDPHFQQQLKDAVQSLQIGAAWDMKTKVPPLIRPPSKVLKRALTQLDQGETWLLQPQPHPDQELLWSPGIKWGVKEGSFMHQTELFGPVLAVMKAKDLSHAIAIVNATPYGLTSALFSLDEREHALWLSQIIAGNCYINRSTTGAIVLRQPFGGCKASQYGRGQKAGGPNYLVQFAHIASQGLSQERVTISPCLEPLLQFAQREILTTGDLELLEGSLQSYTYWSAHFSQRHEMAFLTGQDNFLEYRPYPQMCLRATQNDCFIDFLRVYSAALLCRNRIEVSFSSNTSWITPSLQKLLTGVKWIEESESLFIDRLYKGEIRRVRAVSSVPDVWKEAAAASLGVIISSPICANGRFELLHYLQEVAISQDYHRYGNLGLREDEKRS